MVAVVVRVGWCVKFVVVRAVRSICELRAISTLLGRSPKGGASPYEKQCSALYLYGRLLGDTRLVPETCDYLEQNSSNPSKYQPPLRRICLTFVGGATVLVRRVPVRQRPLATTHIRPTCANAQEVRAFTPSGRMPHHSTITIHH